MDAGEADNLYLELALLLMVTGLFGGVLIISLAIVLGRESTIASSMSLALATGAAIICLLAVVLVLIRRLWRIFRYR